MANAFLMHATARRTDVTSFLREASATNSIKYRGESGAKHQIYYPYKEESDGTNTTKRIEAISGYVHEWNDTEGYHSCICLRGEVFKDEAGNVIRDGSCPICNRIKEANTIANYRIDIEEKAAKLTKSGEDLEKHMKEAKKRFLNERKAKKATLYMYMLMVRFITNEKGTPVLDDTDGLPKFELQVMRVSKSRLEKLKDQLENNGLEMEGAEEIISYPKTDNSMLLVSQSTISLVVEKRMITKLYPDVVAKIDEAVAKFEWDGIEKAFPEWEGMTTEEANIAMDNLFLEWDKYKERLKVDKEAKYLEYSSDKADNPELSVESKPALGVAQGIETNDMDEEELELPDVDATFNNTGINV